MDVFREKGLDAALHSKEKAATRGFERDAHTPKNVRYYRGTPVKERVSPVCVSVATFGALMCVRNYGRVGVCNSEEHLMANAAMFPEIINQYGSRVYEHTLALASTCLQSDARERLSVISPVGIMEAMGIVDPELAEKDGTGEHALGLVLDELEVGSACIILTSARCSCDSMLYAYMVYKQAVGKLLCYDPHPLNYFGTECTPNDANGKSFLCVGAVDYMVSNRHAELHGQKSAFYALIVTSDVFSGCSSETLGMFTLVSDPAIPEAMTPPQTASMGAELGAQGPSSRPLTSSSSYTFEGAAQTTQSVVEDLLEVDRDTLVSCVNGFSNWEVMTSLLFAMLMCTAWLMVLYRQFHVAILVLVCVLVFLLSVVYETTARKMPVW